MSAVLPFTSVAGTGSGELITTMLAATFRFDADVEIATTDVDGASVPRNIELEGWRRILLAASDGDGSNKDELAGDVLRALGAGLGSNYAVTLRSDGRVQIRYLAIGDAIITWTGSPGLALSNVLGFGLGATTILASQGSIAVAPYPPMGVIYCVNVSESRDWNASPTDLALATTNGGRTYGFGSLTHLVRKAFVLGYHPRTWKDAVRLRSVATPQYPEDMGEGEDDVGDTAVRWVRPVAIPSATQYPPHTVHDVIALSRTTPVAALFGRFQLLGGAARYCDLGYLTAEALMAERTTRPSGPGWRERSHREQLEMTRTRILDLTGG